MRNAGGTTTLLSAKQMVSVYVNEAGFTVAVKEATDAAVSAGFILSDDAQDIIDWASEHWRSQLTPRLAPPGFTYPR
jgi:hypothetical protein